MRQNNPLVIAYNFLFALALSVIGAIIVSWPLLFVFIKVQQTYKLVNLSITKIMSNYNQLMWYLVWPFKKKLQMTDFPTSNNAAEHFADVKRLFILAIAVFLICLIVWLIGKKARLGMPKLDRGWIILFMVLPVVILPFAIMNFDSFFILFHHLLFSNSNWLFDPATDPIINVLTEEFFASCFAIGALIYELFFVRKLLAK